MKALVSKPHLLSRVASLTIGKTLGGPGADVTDVPEPTITPDEVLVKVRVVSLNPTDFKHIDAISPPGSIIGCDYAGEVVKVGLNAAKTWSVGDRIAGAVHGGLFPDRGAFADYLKVEGDLAWAIPDQIDDTAAATFGISAVTAMQALNLRLGFPWPEHEHNAEKPPPSKDDQTAPVIFIYAGSTSAGLFTIQLAKLAGYTVVTTASPRSFELVKSYGADAVFNYRDTNVADEIVKQYPVVKVAVDCFSEGQSFSICDAVLQPQGGKLIALLPPAKPKHANVEHELIMSYTLFGRPFQWLPPIGPKFPALPDDRKALSRFYSNLPDLVRKQLLKPPPVTVETVETGGAWDAINSGLDKLRTGKGPAGKIVVRM